MAKTNKDLVRCMDCVSATILQYSKYNPLIALCGESGERDVAMSKRRCALYNHDNKPKEIQTVQQ